MKQLRLEKGVHWEEDVIYVLDDRKLEEYASELAVVVVVGAVHADRLGVEKVYTRQRQKTLVVHYDQSRQWK